MIIILCYVAMQRYMYNYVYMCLHLIKDTNTNTIDINYNTLYNVYIIYHYIPRDKKNSILDDKWVLGICCYPTFWLLGCASHLAPPNCGIRMDSAAVRCLTASHISGYPSPTQQMEVPINGGTSESSILIGFSIINHPFGPPFLGTPK